MRPFHLHIHHTRFHSSIQVYSRWPRSRAEIRRNLSGSWLASPLVVSRQHHLQLITLAITLLSNCYLLENSSSEKWIGNALRASDSHPHSVVAADALVNGALAATSSQLTMRGRF